MTKDFDINSVVATVGGAILTWVVSYIMESVAKHVKAALEPVFCPDCGHELQRDRHDIFICIGCYMPFQVRHDGIYPLNYNMRY